MVPTLTLHLGDGCCCCISKAEAELQEQRTQKNVEKFATLRTIEDTTEKVPDPT